MSSWIRTFVAFVLPGFETSMVMLNAAPPGNVCTGADSETAT